MVSPSTTVTPVVAPSTPIGPPSKGKIRWLSFVLSAVLVILFLVAIFFGNPAITTFFGAVIVGIGGVVAIIDRMKVERKVRRKENAENTPIALIGIGGALVAGGALDPALSVVRTAFGW